MKIRKNGKVISLTESDLKRIVKKAMLSEAVAAAPNIAVDPDNAKFGYFNGKSYTPSGNITLEPEDKLQMFVFIPSSAPKGSIVTVRNSSIGGGGTVKSVAPTTTDGESAGAKRFGIESPSFVFVKLEFDSLESVAKSKGTKLPLKLTGNFEGGKDITIPVTIPTEMNVIQGGAKS